MSAGADGFSLQCEGGDFRLQFRGYAQFDGRFFSGDEGALAVDTFVLRRVRPILQGTVGKYFDFSLMPDFGGGTAVLQDAWLDFKPSPKLRVSVGKFKAPVGLERLQSATAIAFVERAFPTALVPNRDVGMQVHGELAGGVRRLRGRHLRRGPRRRQRRHRRQRRQGPRRPRLPLPLQEGPVRPQGPGLRHRRHHGQAVGPPARLPLGGTDQRHHDPHRESPPTGRARADSPQLSFYSGPLRPARGVRPVRLQGQEAQTAHAFDLDARAWQATATVALTGDKASYGGVRPAKPFDPAKGQWGALELAARVHGLELSRESVDAGLVDPDALGRKITAWAVGLTWYLTRNVKQFADFEHVSLQGRRRRRPDRDSENAVFIRTQVSF